MAAVTQLCQTLLHEGDGSVGAQSEAQKLAQETLDEAVPLLDALSQSEYEATTAVLKVQWYTAGPVARLAMVSPLPLHAACTLNCAEAPVQPAELEKCSVVFTAVGCGAGRWLRPMTPTWQCCPSAAGDAHNKGVAYTTLVSSHFRRV